MLASLPMGRTSGSARRTQGVLGGRSPPAKSAPTWGCALRERLRRSRPTAGKSCGPLLDSNRMKRRGRPRHPDILTPREWEVLALLRDRLANPEIAGYLEKYLRGKDATARDRVQLFKLAWDMIGEQFGSRQLQYEWFYAGDPYFTRQRFYRSPMAREYKDIVNRLLKGRK